MSGGRELLLDAAPGAASVAVAALLADGRLQELRVAPPSDGAPAPGEIWAARVDRVVPEQGAAFLDLGGGRAAYLPEADGLSSGQALRVEIARAAEPPKAARATRRLTFSTPLVAHTPTAPGLNFSRKFDKSEGRAALDAALRAAAPGYPGALGWDPLGLVVRTAAASQAPAVVVAAAARCWAAAAEVAEAAPTPPRRLRAAPDLEMMAAIEWRPDRVRRRGPSEAPGALLQACGLLEEIVALCARRAPLKEGALILERTMAAVTIDVDTGVGASARAVNLAAAAEIPRQLRLRDWGGPIVIDFAPIAERDAGRERARIEARLRQAADPDLSIAGWGPLGLLEARRRRRRPPLETLWPVVPPV